MTTWFENMQNLAQNPPPKAATPILVKQNTSTTPQSDGINIGPFTIDPTPDQQVQPTQINRTSTLTPSIRTQDTFFYPLYEKASYAADVFDKYILQPFQWNAQFMPTIAGAPSQVATGVYSGISSGIRTLGMVPSGSEMLVRETANNPAAIIQYGAAGLGMQAEGLYKGFTSNPAKTVGELAGMSLLFYGAGRGVGYLSKPATTAMRYRMTEFNIGRQIPNEHLINMRAVSTIGRNVKGLKSDFMRDPNLSKVERIGPQYGPSITKILAEQEHSIYGSATRLGQMPMSVQPRAVHDIDVFVPDIVEFNMKAVKVLGPEFKIEGNTVVKLPGGHAIDTHVIPPNYPLKGTGIKFEYHQSEIAPNLPFDFMPNVLLKGRQLTQEHLFTQAQRKAASVMGTPATNGIWKFGPEAHRLKDIGDLLFDTEYLIKANKASYNPLTQYKVFRLNQAIKTLKSSESFQALYDPAKGITNKIKGTHLKNPSEVTIKISQPPTSAPTVPKSNPKSLPPFNPPSPSLVPSKIKSSTSIPKSPSPSIPKQPSIPKYPTTPSTPKFRPPSIPTYNPPSRTNRPPSIPTYLIPSEPKTPPSLPMIINPPQRFTPPSPPPIIQRVESVSNILKPDRDPFKVKGFGGIKSKGWHIKNAVPNLKLVFGKNQKLKLPRIKGL